MSEKFFMQRFGDLGQIETNKDHFLSQRKETRPIAPHRSPRAPAHSCQTCDNSFHDRVQY